MKRVLVAIMVMACFILASGLAFGQPKGQPNGYIQGLGSSEDTPLNPSTDVAASAGAGSQTIWVHDTDVDTQVSVTGAEAEAEAKATTAVPSEVNVNHRGTVNVRHEGTVRLSSDRSSTHEEREGHGGHGHGSHPSRRSCSTPGTPTSSVVIIGTAPATTTARTTERSSGMDPLSIIILALIIVGGLGLMWAVAAAVAGWISTVFSTNARNVLLATQTTAQGANNNGVTALHTGDNFIPQNVGPDGIVDYHATIAPGVCVVTGHAKMGQSAVRSQTPAAAYQQPQPIIINNPPAAAAPAPAPAPAVTFQNVQQLQQFMSSVLQPVTVNVNAAPAAKTPAKPKK